MQKPTITPRSAGSSEQIALGGCLKDASGLVAHLHDETWDDGSSRQRSTLSVFIEDAVVKCCLNDREFSRSLFATGDTLEAAVRSLEKQVSKGEGADWRKWKKSGKGR